MSRWTLILLALALFAFAPIVYAADGTTADRKAYALDHPCPATGKRIVTCSGGWQLVWDRAPCLLGARLTWMKISAAKAKIRSTEFAAACLRSKAAYDACVAKPITVTPMCATTRGPKPCLAGQKTTLSPATTWRDCSVLVK